MGRMMYPNRLRYALQVHKDKTGKTIIDMATEMDMSYNTLMYYTRGVNQPSVRRAIKIANYLGLKVEAIWTAEK